MLSRFLVSSRRTALAVQNKAYVYATLRKRATLKTTYKRFYSEDTRNADEADSNFEEEKPASTETVKRNYYERRNTNDNRYNREDRPGYYRENREKITDFAEAQEKGLSTTSLIGILTSDPTMGPTEILDNLEMVLAANEERKQSGENSAYAYKDSYRLVNASVPLGHKLFSRLHQLNSEDKGGNVQDSVLFSNVIKIFTKYKLLHVSHMNRYLQCLINEGQFSRALSTWISALDYFKGQPERMVDFRETSGHTPKSFIGSTEQFFYSGLVSYILSLEENNSKLDPDFVELILKDLGSDPSFSSLSNFFRLTHLDNKLANHVKYIWMNYLRSKIDYNNKASWANVLTAAKENKTAKVEDLIKNNIANAEKKGQALTSETWAHIMLIYTVDKNYTKALSTWKMATQDYKITPTVALWNQLLLANARSSSANRLLRIESVWKLLKNSDCKPNAESYRYLMEGYSACGLLSKSMKTLEKVEEEHPEFPVSGLKEQLISGMIENGFGKEADQLFKLYNKENLLAEAERKNGDGADAEKGAQIKADATETFKPSIVLYNKLLHYFLKNDRFDSATEILNDMIEAGKKDKSLAPDIATWTTVVDMLMKQAKKIGASEEFITNELSKILQAMRDNNIRLNEQAMTMIVTNLSRNPRTAELGWQFFLTMKKASKRLSTVTYTSVIYSECLGNRMDRALELFTEGLEEGIKLRPQYYNLIFKGFSDHPNVESTMKFYKFINMKTKGKPDEVPNFFTFYYLLRGAMFSGDKKFVQFVVDEMDKSELKHYGKMIPGLLEEVEGTGMVTVPESLKKRVEEDVNFEKNRKQQPKEKARYE